MVGDTPTPYKLVDDWREFTRIQLFARDMITELFVELEKENQHNDKEESSSFEEGFY